jgi:O-antigen/teichoic acid export membrane protein
LKNIKKLSTVFVINLIAGLGYSILLARVLGVEERGIVYAYQMPSLFIVSLIFSVFSQPIYEDYKKRNEDTADFLFIIKCLALCSLLSVITCVIYQLLLAKNIELWLLVLITLAQGINIFFMELSKFNKNTSRYILSTAAMPTFLFTVTGVYYYTSASFDSSDAVTAILTAYVCSAFVTLLVISNQIDFSLKVNNQKTVTAFVKRIADMFIFRALGTVAIYIDKMLIITFFPANIIGLVAACMSLESVSSRLYQTLANFQMNKIANRDGQLQSDKSFFIIILLLSITGITFSIIFGELLVTLIFGQAFAQASSYLPVIIATSVINGFAWVVTQSWLLDASYTKVYLRQLLGISVLLLSFTTSIVMEAGIIGLLYSALLSALAKLIYTYVIYQQQLPLTTDNYHRD